MYLAVRIDEFEIKLLEQSEVITLAKFGHDIFKITYEHMLRNEFERLNFRTYLKNAFSVEQINKELCNSNVEFYGLFYKKQMIGYVKLNYLEAQSIKKPNNYLEIERIYLDSDFQRIGLGKFMLDWVFELGRKKNHEFLWLRTWERNKAAILFYKKHGFIYVGKESYKFEESDDVDYVFEKKL